METENMNKRKTGKKVIVVMPAYYAEKTLEKTYQAVPKEFVDEIILVDDASKDKTAEIARSLGLKVIIHEQNRGYGGNQKTCYTEALKDNGEIIVMLHPDYQYEPAVIPEMIKPIREEKADIVYGSRMLISGMAQAGGMPWWKRFGNKMLTFYFNILLGTYLTDAATGYIAYSRKVLETIPFMKNDNGFTFDEEVIIQATAFKFRAIEVPIPTRYENESSSISFKKSVKYGWSIFTKVLKYKLHQLGLKKYDLLVK
jgi:glycosyltransferase involved in cell wall biosynthesis